MGGGGGGGGVTLADYSFNRVLVSNVTPRMNLQNNFYDSKNFAQPCHYCSHLLRPREVFTDDDTEIFEFRPLFNWMPV